MLGTDGIWVLPPALIVATAIIVCEIWRTPPRSGVDLLRAINLLYAVIFSFCPIVLAFAPVIDVGSWNYVYELAITGNDLAIAEWLAVLGYACLLGGYFSFDSFTGFRNAAAAVRRRLRHQDATSSYRWDHVAFVMGLVGAIALIEFTRIIGGLWSLVAYGMIWRMEGTPIETPWLFLKNLALFLVPASLIYFVISQIRRTFSTRLLFVLTLGGAMLILFHHGGRLQLLSYLLTFPIALALVRGGLRLRHVAVAAVGGLAMVAFGKEILTLVYNPEAVTASIETASSEPGVVLFRSALEFSFPSLILAKTVDSVPTVEPFRWLIDLYMGMVSLLPQKFLGTELPRTVTSVILDMVHAPIPADLLSFGYFSLGVSGCVVAATFFGVTSRFIENCFGNPKSLSQAILYVAWMFFWAFRLMYGDPSHATVSGFSLAVATIFLLFPRSRTRPPASGASTPTGVVSGRG